MDSKQRYAVAFGLSALLHGVLFFSLRDSNEDIEVKDIDQTLVELQIDEPPPEPSEPPPPPLLQQSKPLETPTPQEPLPITPPPPDPSIAEKHDTAQPPPEPVPATSTAISPPSPANASAGAATGSPHGSTQGVATSTVGEASLKNLDNKDFKPFGNRRPSYPEVARQLGVEGSVLLEVLVSEKGVVEQVRVLEIKGHPSFGEAAKRTAASWRFVPPRSGGKQVKVWYRQEVLFRLKE